MMNRRATEVPRADLGIISGMLVGLFVINKGC
jgi:hypothetical protein